MPAIVDAAIFDRAGGMSVPAVLVTDRRQQAWDAAMDRISRLL